ncbi:hypothetical protein PR003_g6337 [Phytophthora rubi]|uniref:Uncharacterized protein n=1 Tax=Phytophthora rubi TaxID=129364 RepID=A0A6A4FMR8_9STRA|nr:hypothetical protein PR002_g3824 [Phytophthora rubi]KAE9042898.1 hypothetical protein PR001_g6006 [Phytophthora rubi]KAE9348574.1 hypothetical protein PR003_g6337 [Phytophthora rubi]
MQFTQHLVDTGRYAPSMNIGNWNEDLMLEEARMKAFTLRKAQGSLLATQTLKGSFLNPKTPRSFDHNCRVHLNQTVTLGHLESDVLSACNIFEETPIYRVGSVSCHRHFFQHFGVTQQQARQSITSRNTVNEVRCCW